MQVPFRLLAASASLSAKLAQFSDSLHAYQASRSGPIVAGASGRRFPPAIANQAEAYSNEDISAAAGGAG